MSERPSSARRIAEHRSIAAGGMKNPPAGGLFGGSLAFVPLSASTYTWIALALLVLMGGWVIRRVSEQKWGRYSNA